MQNKYTKDYFADTAFFIGDRSESDDLNSLLSSINKICFDAQTGKYNSIEKIEKLLELLHKNNVKIKIPCLMAFTSDIYKDPSVFKNKIESITNSMIKYFDTEIYPINIGIDFDILFYIFPIDSVPEIRRKIVELKKEAK